MRPRIKRKQAEYSTSKPIATPAAKRSEIERKKEVLAFYNSKTEAEKIAHKIAVEQRALQNMGEEKYNQFRNGHKFITTL